MWSVERNGILLWLGERDGFATLLADGALMEGIVQVPLLRGSISTSTGKMHPCVDYAIWRALGCAVRYEGEGRVGSVEVHSLSLCSLASWHICVTDRLFCHNLAVAVVLAS